MRQATIYRHGGEWCYALVVDGEHDHSDTIGCADDATAAEAEADLRSQLGEGDLEVHVFGRRALRVAR